MALSTSKCNRLTPLPFKGLNSSLQACSPQDRGLSLESTRDQFYAVLVLVLVLVLRATVLDLVLVLPLLVLTIHPWLLQYFPGNIINGGDRSL